MADEPVADGGDPGVRPLLRQAARPVCTAEVEDDAGGPRQCGKPSRFIVIRDDGDNSYGTGWGGTREACDEHLAATVTATVDGDDVHAIVTPRSGPQAGSEEGL